MSRHTINRPALRELMEANVIRGASIIGQPGGWSVLLQIGMGEKPLGTQRTDKPRTWRSLDACMAYLRTELHIVRVGVDASNYSAESPSRPRRDDQAERMRRAHEAAAYDAWFRQQVQASIDDPRPSVPHGEVMGRAQGLIDRLRAEKAARDADTQA